MNFKQLKTISKHKKAEVKDLFLETFTASESEKVGKMVSGLVQKLLDEVREEKIVYAVVNNEKVIGCIIFNEIKLEKSDQKVFQLTVFAVSSKYQGQGLGKKLIEFAKSDLKKKGATALVTYGYTWFYSKVGFKTISNEILEPPHQPGYPDGWMGISLTDEDLKHLGDNPVYNKYSSDKKFWVN